MEKSLKNGQIVDIYHLIKLHFSKKIFSETSFDPEKKSFNIVNALKKCLYFNLPISTKVNLPKISLNLL